MLIALLDGAQTVLEWVDQYGADKVFMVLFMILYMRSQKKLGTLQDRRLADSKEALQALIEAKHVFGELANAQKRMNEEFVKHTHDDDKHFCNIEDKLDRLIEQNGWAND